MNLLYTLKNRLSGQRKIVEHVLFYRGTVLNIDLTARIKVTNGLFSLNASWAANDPFKTFFVLRKNANLLVNNDFAIYTGARIYVNEGATLILGGGYINHNLNLSCFEKIEIGNNVAVSENVTIRDSDNHYVQPSNGRITQPVKIGNNVWIGMNVTILKGVNIGDGAVVAANSLVNKDIPEKCLAGGVPATVLRTNVEWK